MIISASRRTDIPAYFSDWFFNRIKEKYVLVRNPMNAHQVSKINLSLNVVDCIVFWTKNPAPMLDRLHELKDYPFYFHFTLTSYDKDIEQNVPSKSREVIDIFRRLSDKIGPDRVIWRYDPILINSKYTKEYHIEYFGKLAEKLQGYTKKCTISFLDFYPKIKKRIAPLDMIDISYDKQREIAKELFQIASSFGIKMNTCAEKIDLADLGISHGKCIDDELISRIIGSPIKVERDKNQRTGCGCMASMDIGQYSTCLNGCVYCYANQSMDVVQRNFKKYNVNSPILCSQIGTDDVISEREMKSLKIGQMNLFD